MNYCMKCGKLTDNGMICENCLVNDSPWLSAMKIKENDLEQKIAKLEAENAELHHRAEVAEKERNEQERKTEIAQKAGKIIQQVVLRVFSSENPIINDKINALWDLALQQAEREIAKENQK